MVKQLRGEFALVLRDTDQREIFLARDIMGSHPLYYQFGVNGELHFAHRLPDLLKHGVNSRPDTHWITHYLLDNSMNSPRCAYSGIHKLPAGHWLWLRRGHPPKIQRYHHWQSSPEQGPRDWVGRYRECLELALTRRLPDTGPVGIELSGGLDSSSLAAVAAKLRQPDLLRSLSVLQSTKVRRAVESVCRQSGIKPLSSMTSGYRRCDDAELDAWLDLLGSPPEHINTVFLHPFLGQCQQAGVKTLLSGFGGDECVTGSGWQARLMLWQAGHYRQALRRYRGPWWARGLRLIREHMDPPKERFRAHRLHNLSWFRPHLRDPLQQTLVSEDAPPREINALAMSRLASARMSARLETGTLAAHKLGLRYSWPLLDPDLIQCYLNAPPEEKYGPGGISRYLHRRAVQHELPDEIVWRPSKDMGLPDQFDALRRQRLIELETDMESLQRQLHPVLEEYLDQDYMAQRPWRAEIGRTSNNFRYMTTWVLPMLRWRFMNRWLHRVLPP